LEFAGFWLPSIGTINLVNSESGTLNGGATIQPRAGGKAYRLNGTGNIVTLIPTSSTLLPTTQGVTFVFSGTVITRVANGDFGILNSGAPVGERCGCHFPYTDGTVYFDYGGATNGSTRVQVASLTFAESDVFVFSVGARGMEIWQNGVLRASNGANPSRSASSSSWGLGGNNSDGASASPNAAWTAVGMTRRQLSSGICAQLSSDLWGTAFVPDARRIYFDAGAGGGEVTLSPTEGHISVVGYSPGLSQARTLAPSTGTLHLVGYQPGIVQSAGQTLFPSTGHKVLQGYAPSLSQARTLAPATGTELLQGYIPGVFQSVITTLAPSTGHLVLTGSVPGITQARTLAPSTGHVYLAGYAPVVEQVAGAQTLAPLTGSIILSGHIPTVSNAPSQPSSSSYSFGGGGGGGKRAWKEAGFDEKLDKIVEEWQEQHSPKPASKPAQDPVKPETAPVPAKEAREDEREELDQSALADLIADRVVAKLTPLLASNKQLAEEAFIFRLIQAGKL
jgi:hypothetical protein